MSSVTYRARWIIPVTSPPLENGRLSVEHGRIAALERAGGPDPSAIDLGDVALLPGFVNGHTHLELTACRGRVPFRGSFVDWIKAVTRVNPHLEGDEAVDQSVRSGLTQSRAAGVTTVADIGAGQRVFDAWADAAIHTVGFLEVMGIGPAHRRSVAQDRSFEAAAVLGERVSATLNDGPAPAPAGPPIRRVGISPHAPYSTAAKVYRDAVAFARPAGRPICTHLAETREEEQFLRSARGPFRDLLEEFGLWDGSFTPPGCSPVQYARQLGLLDCQPLLAHVNYVSYEDLALLAESNASVVYCPRAHRFFEHPSHPWRAMLDLGINVCVGTDSLAGNDTLSILDELRFLRQLDRTIDGETLLALGTIAGARALQLDCRIGSLEVGKRADFVAIPLTDHGTDDPIDDLLSGSADPAAVYLAGAPATPPQDGG